jgi:hypothetical protein
MAVFKPIIADSIHGSIGGLTFQSGPFSIHQVRSKPIPSSSSSNLQTYIRSCFGSSSHVLNKKTISQKILFQEISSQTSIKEFPHSSLNNSVSYFSARFSSLCLLRRQGVFVPLTYNPDTYPGYIPPPSLTILPPLGINVGFRLRWKNVHPYVCRLCIYVSQPIRSTRKKPRIPHFRYFFTRQYNPFQQGDIFCYGLRHSSNYYCYAIIVRSTPKMNISQRLYFSANVS